MQTLLIEKKNYQFQTKTQSRNQHSGLTVCLRMITQSVKDVGHVAVETFEEVNMAIERFRPMKVLVQSVWMSDEEMRVLSERYPLIHFFIHIHSNVPFLACEHYAFRRFVEARKHNWGIVVNDYRAVDIVPDAIYLPNIYSHPMLPIVKKEHKETFDVICAGSLRPMKNHVNQALAAIKHANMTGRKLRFHINASRSEGGESIGAALHALFDLHPPHILVPISWMEHTDFIKYCHTMDLGLQVSMSESFNIVAADYVAAGIPMVVSDEISWANGLIQARHGSSSDIANCIHYAGSCIEDNRLNLAIYNKRAKREWTKFNEA